GLHPPVPEGRMPVEVRFPGVAKTLRNHSVGRVQLRAEALRSSRVTPNTQKASKADHPSLQVEVIAHHDQWPNLRCVMQELARSAKMSAQSAHDNGQGSPRCEQRRRGAERAVVSSPLVARWRRSRASTLGTAL